MFTRIGPPLQATLMPTGSEPDRLPPFWELEDLIASGLDQSTALNILALRRAQAEPGRAPAALYRPGDPWRFNRVELDEVSDSVA
ncbi:hypothetical protein FG93_02653 [Bosea sp. LC85]|uniref:hypothetical protein n=1 Tax=Bosea sp. LC85 TaxID=1502851 RepID=UPI0004E37EF1|nr:hypothetical protein [Bosea sp. LC85]KFC70896.1 hypothetical protein FG93_02653 [Bosea sp. LC85]